MVDGVVVEGNGGGRRFRSRDWFEGSDRMDQTALYLERFMNYGITPDELRSGRPVIGISQTGSDLVPCNRHHLDLAVRVKEGIRDAGGIPMEFPVHPVFENCRRPTAALDRNLSYLGLVETLYGYPLDAVVLTTGCDKTTPAAIMAASTVDIPSIVLSGGPMLDGWFEGELVGSGMAIWKSRRRLAAGQIDEEEFYETALASAPSMGSRCPNRATSAPIRCHPPDGPFEARAHRNGSVEPKLGVSAAASPTPHTREVAGSNPAAPILQRPCSGGVSALGTVLAP